MCGIAGLINFDSSQPVDKSILRHMLDQLRHRGPDDRGEKQFQLPNGGTMQLGHQRFSIIDLSKAGHQPMPNDDQSIWISTNSEIYNYKELRNELSSHFQFKSESDTEVLLRAYERWGEGCLDKLIGMFSFAIWDSQREALLIARDRLGIKPLYYHMQEQQLVFASELRSLLSSGLIEYNINPTGVYHYLSFGHFISPETIIDSVRELKPGNYLWVDKNGNWEEKEYWNLFQGKVTTEQNPEEQIKEVMKQAIDCHRVGDVPLGAFLSGGIDSSIVVGNLAEISGNPVTTLNIGFEEKEFDESEYSQEIANTFQTQHHVSRLSPNQLLQSLPDSLSAMDQPTIDGINIFLISRTAQEIGLKVVLSGLGGDELFGGYPSFRLIPKLRKQWLKFLPQGLLNWGAGLGKSLFPSDQTTKLDHWIQGKLSGAHEYFLIRALFCQDPVAHLFENHDQVQIEIEKNYHRTESLINKDVDLFNQISHLETVHYLQNMLLRDTDMMSMAHPIEVRVPFMDHRLVELMFNIEGYKKSGAPKSLLVNSMKPLLPESVWRRKKMGFTFPFESWMRGALRLEIEPVLLTQSKKLEGLLSQTAVEKTWFDFLSGKISWSRPWALYVLKEWVNKNLES